MRGLYTLLVLSLFIFGLSILALPTVSAQAVCCDSTSECPSGEVCDSDGVCKPSCPPGDDAFCGDAAPCIGEICRNVNSDHCNEEEADPPPQETCEYGLWTGGYECSAYTTSYYWEEPYGVCNEYAKFSCLEFAAGIIWDEEKTSVYVDMVHEWYRYDQPGQDSCASSDYYASHPGECWDRDIADLGDCYSVGDSGTTSGNPPQKLVFCHECTGDQHCGGDEGYCENNVCKSCPEEGQIWNGEECVTPEVYVWNSNCEVEGECGSAMADIWCESESSGAVVDDGLCDSNTRPSEYGCIQTCSGDQSCDYSTNTCQDPDTPVWWTGDWSDCSEDCDGGTRTRDVECHVDGQQVDDSECSGSKPDSSEDCNTHSCNGNDDDDDNGGSESSPPVCGNYDNPCQEGTRSGYDNSVECGSTSWQCVKSGYDSVDCSQNLGTDSCGDGSCSNNVCYAPLTIEYLTADPSSGSAPVYSDISLRITGGVVPITYTLDLGNGNSHTFTSSSTNPITHQFLGELFDLSYGSSSQTYTVDLSVSDSDSSTSSVQDSVNIIVTNDDPEIIDFSVTPSSDNARYTADYTLEVVDDSPGVDWFVEYMDGSSDSGSMTKDGNEFYASFSKFIEYPTDVCGDDQPWDFVASVTVTDTYGATDEASATTVVHPILPSDSGDDHARCSADCDESEGFFKGGCYPTGDLNVSVVLYEEGLNLRLASYSVIELVNNVDSSLNQEVSADVRGEYLFENLILGDYDNYTITATYLDAYTDTQSISVAVGGVTHLPFEFFEDVYNEDCTNAFNRCDRQAIGNGCLMDDSDPLYEDQVNIMNMCHPEGTRGYRKGTLIPYDSNGTHTQYANCCLETTDWMATPKADIESNASMLIRHVRQTSYRGLPARLVITTWS